MTRVDARCTFAFDTPVRCVLSNISFTYHEHTHTLYNVEKDL